MDSALKVAKKILKKDDSESMKMKSLAKKVVKKMEEESTVDDVKSWIEKSDLFLVDGKLVSLVKKRKNKDDDDGKAKKKSKKSTSDEVVSSGLDGETVKKWRKENKVVLMDAYDDENGQKETEKLAVNKAYLPYTTFESPGCKEKVHEALLKHCTQVKHFLKPSPIQAQCWPVLLHSERRDVVGIAETGSGKTLAFGIPALTSLSDGFSQKKKPRMLVLAPTRELAMQSHVVLEEFGSIVNLTSIVVYGGVPKNIQKNELKKGVDCVVATPGRLKDLIQEGSCDLSQVSQLVLDEADRMLDMGFEEDVRFIISNCQDKSNRQTAMFSATWPAAIQKIAMDYMTRPVRVYVGFEAIVSGETGEDGQKLMDDSLSANKRVSQTVHVMDEQAKQGHLQKLLQKYGTSGDRVLIFALYKKEAARLEQTLKRWRYDCNSIHGDKTQEARTKALADFKSGECPLLIGTDVAARGLDIPNVQVVINYTFPLTIEDYVHRIGRTGRAGKTGISHTFFTPQDKSHAGELQQVMRQAGQSVPDELMKFGSTIKKKEHKLYGNFGPSSSSLPMKKATKITFDSDDE
jgi:ATP-dependent RNA helicase DBP3